MERLSPSALKKFPRMLSSFKLRYFDIAIAREDARTTRLFPEEHCGISFHLTTSYAAKELRLEELVYHRYPDADCAAAVRL